jgi:hypothetical protein
MNRLFLALIPPVLVAACSFSVPVTGSLGGQAAQGAATAKANGAGTFYVVTIDGLRCDGTYDAMTDAPTITAPVKCNDGRTGQLVITRSMDGLSGTVMGRLNDGTEGRFVFGNLRFDQTFGDGRGAGTAALQ